MIEQGSSDTEKYLGQLDQARVISQCDCGCASFNLQIGNHPADSTAGMEIISDYIVWNGRESIGGVFVYLQDGMLSGLEAHRWLDKPLALPNPEMLIPLEEAHKRNIPPSR